MEKSSKAYKRFQGILERSLALVNPSSPFVSISEQALSDIIRGAVVLAVSAMDDYFTSIFAEHLVPFLKKESAKDTLVELLLEAGLDTKKALELFSKDRPYRFVRTLMDSYLERHTTQHFNKIDKLFLAYGIKDFCHNVDKKVSKRKEWKEPKEAVDGTIPLGTCRRRIRDLVERRHLIVHSGDLDKNGKIIEISLDKVGKQLNAVSDFVYSAEDILQKRLS